MQSIYIAPHQARLRRPLGNGCRNRFACGQATGAWRRSPRATGNRRKAPTSTKSTNGGRPSSLKHTSESPRRSRPGRSSSGLRKLDYRRRPTASPVVWTARNVIELIRRIDYRGEQRYRVVISKKTYRDGKRKATRNAPDQVLVRPMPHLRIVPDWLWFAANKAIDERGGHREPRGADHPLAGIPRNSRGPLSEIFRCNCCGEKMHMNGRNEGGYRCSQAGKNCWNKATALSAMTHTSICEAILREVHAALQNGGVDRLLQQAAALLGDNGQREDRRVSLLEEETRLETRSAIYGDMVEKADGTTENHIGGSRAGVGTCTSSCVALDGLSSESKCCTPPTRQEIEAPHRRNQRTPRANGSERVGEALELLVGRIDAVPLQQFAQTRSCCERDFSFAWRLFCR